MGNLMRRRWIPAILSEQVAEPDGTPVRLRLLGEFCPNRNPPPGIPNQDIAMWESMCVIAARSAERVGSIGQVEPPVPRAKLRSYQCIVPKIQNWHLLGIADEDLPGVEEDATDREMEAAE